MTLRFVKTAILSSTDGIDFGSEVAVESEEVLKARVEAAASANKPLYQQLAELRDQKQLEYDENTKKIFAPPKALDEDEIEFFEELDTAKVRAENAARRQEDIELEAFRESRRMEMLKEPTNASNAVFKLPQKKVDQGIKVGVTVKAKRKISDATVSNDPELKKKTSESRSNLEKSSESTGAEKTRELPTSTEKQSTPSPSTVPVTKSVTTSGTTSLFAEYDSD